MATIAVNDNSSNQEALTIKDKASAKLGDVDINSLPVFVFDEEQSFRQKINHYVVGA